MVTNLAFSKYFRISPIENHQRGFGSKKCPFAEFLALSCHFTMNKLTHEFQTMPIFVDMCLTGTKIGKIRNFADLSETRWKPRS